MSSNFDNAFVELIGIEGGYVDDPVDRGGETKFGISKRAYPNVDIKNLTLEDAKQIYWNDFWNPLLLAQCNWYQHKLEIFEQAVNFGKWRATIHVQQALHFLGRTDILADGVMGPKTMAALNELKHEKAVIFLKIMNGLQFSFYLEIVKARESQKRFFVGWIKRVEFNGEDIRHPGVQGA